MQQTSTGRPAVLVAGGSGFVGRRLVERLLADGVPVRVMTRNPGTRHDEAVDVYGDVDDPASLDGAFEGVDRAVYLVHSLDHDDFEDRDRRGAQAFADAARRAGVVRIVYLGGLGADDTELSPHLRSRREVERILADAADTVALRAAVVVGQGSISWEMLCQLVERLPGMVTPRWVNTPTQPIALDDVVEYLARSLDPAVVPAGHYDVGVPEPTTYRAMIDTVARLLHRPLVILPVPLLTPRLSAWWLRGVTSVDLTTAKALVESLDQPVVVGERTIEDLTGHRAMPFLDAAEIALRERLAAAVADEGRP